MKYFYLLSFLVFTSFVDGQIINFPDANFKAKIMQPFVAIDAGYNNLTIDANNDGEIEVSEVQDVYQLDVSNANISDLTGISYFTGLKYLRCQQNLLTDLTIDNAIRLEYLNASNNNIASISIHMADNVEGFDLSSNHLTSFTVPSAVYYEAFNLNNNQLTSLTIDHASFENFNINNNHLSTIQVLGNSGIYSYASFANNQFTQLDYSHFGGADWDDSSLDLQGNDNLESITFGIYHNPAHIYYSSANSTSLNLNSFSNMADCMGTLAYLTIANSPNLQHVNFKNGFNHGVVGCDVPQNPYYIPGLNLGISNCPNLSYLCVDEGERDFFQARINELGLQNQVEVNSYCTFTPGGTFYTVNGSTRFDFNANGCDTGDFQVPNQKFTITNGSEYGTIISSDLGNYSIDVGPGTHTITPILDNPSLFTISPSTLAVDFPTQSSPVAQNFCISANTPTHDFDVTLIPVTKAVPGFDSDYKIVFKNTGNVVESGSINLAYQDDVLDFVSSSDTSVMNATGNLSWLFTNLMPFETRAINVKFNLNGPMETPPLNGNDLLHFTTAIAETGASQPFPNNHTLNQTVRNSYDPNDKICLEGQNLTDDFIGNYVSYQIRFENTGTFAAENVVVKDMIDVSKFDITSLTPVSGSHHFYTRISGNKVEFVFENINLPFDDANNDGYVAFKIRLLPGVTENIPFDNKADIYFDYNFPVETNTATSVIGTLGLPTFDLTDQITLSPVPAQNILKIHSKDNLEFSGIEIYNNLGQVVQKGTGNQHEIDVSRLAKGTYYLKINAGGIIHTKQFLKA